MNKKTIATSLIGLSLFFAGCGNSEPQPSADEKKQIETALDNAAARQKIADDALTWGMCVSDDFSRQVHEADNLIQSDKKQRPDAPEWKDQKTDEALMKKYKKYTERRIEQRSDKNLLKNAIPSDK